MTDTGLKDLLRGICDQARRRGAQFADARLFAEDRTSVRVQDGKADKVSQDRS